MRTEDSTEKPKTFGPYMPIRQVGSTYYVAGQIGVDPTTHTADSNISEQVDQALKNLGTVLQSAGLSYDHVVKTTLYLTDMDAFATVNEIYVKHFNEPRPARTTVGVSDLPHVLPGTKLLFEIDAVAYKEAA